MWRTLKTLLIISSFMFLFSAYSSTCDDSSGNSFSCTSSSSSSSYRLDIIDVYYSGGNLVIKLEEAMTSYEKDYITVRKGAITGSSLRFTITQNSTTQFTLYAFSESLAAGDYYVTFKPGAFRNSSGSSKGVIYKVRVY